MIQQTQNELLKNWKQEPLKEVLETLESGGRPKGGAQKEGIPSIGGEHLNSNGRFNFETMKFVPENYFKAMNRGLIKKEDVLIVKDGATTGKTSFVDKNFPYENSAVNEHVFIARPNIKLFPKYLFYFLYSGNGQQQLKKCITGSAQGGINLSILDHISIIYPESKDMQVLIVSAIETQFTRLDEAVKNLKIVKQKLEIYRKSVLKKAFEKKDGWEEKKISELCEIKGGKRVPKGEKFSETKTVHPYLRVTDFENYSINQEGLCFVTEETFKKISRYIINEDEVFISIAGTIGRVGMIPENLNGANLTENAAKLTNFKNIFPRFMMYYLASPYLEQVISFSTKATSQPKLALFRIGNMNLNYPMKIEEQQQIVSEIESKFSVIDKVEQIVEGSLEKAEKLRKSILKSAFEGKLVKNG